MQLADERTNERVVFRWRVSSSLENVLADFLVIDHRASVEHVLQEFSNNNPTLAL